MIKPAEKRILTSAAALFVSALMSVYALAASALPVSDETAATLASLTSEKGGTEAWAQSLAAGDEWYVIAASNLEPSLDFSHYASSAKEAYGSSPPGAVERQRAALALTAAGYGSDPFVKATPDETIGEGGVMSYIFGLHLANNGITGSLDGDAIIDVLLNLRKDDGGWTVRGDFADVDVTAMAITSLSPHVNDRADVKDAVDRALALLSERQNERGGFSSFGVENSESTAQVMIALASLGRDADTDEAFVKNGRSVADALADYRLTDGTYSHTNDGKTNAMATVQALSALIARDCARAGAGSFYIFTARQSETPPETNDAASDQPSSSETSSRADESTSPESGETGNSADGTGKKTDARKYIKIAIAAAVFAAGAVVVTVRVVRGKRRPADNIIIAVVFAAVAILILTVKIESPAEHFADGTEVSETVGTVTVSADASAIRGMDGAPDELILIPPVSVGVGEGSTVLDVITEAARRAGVLLEFDSAGTYLRGIDGIREFGFGSLSGWKYSVNGEYPSVSCAEYELSPGDVVVWEYVIE